MPDPRSNNRRIGILTIFSIVFIFTVITLYFLRTKVSLPDLLLFNLYVPGNNIILAPVINGHEFYKYFYFTYLSTLLILFISRFLGAFKVHHRNLAFLFVNPLMILFASFCCFQLLSLHVFHLNKLFQYFGQSAEFKNAQILIDSTYDQDLPLKTTYDDYRFLLEGKKRLTETHIPELLTDYDLSVDPGMYIHRFISFHLYPLDLRHIKGKEANCYILFHKNNAIDHIPEGYVPLYVHGKSHIIAVRGE
ncbi:MAG: hypothetical protein K8S27_01995 [Candidatus Omnitrophica bacterium]|nr:hypothetical protein [Candidatus Omnitrophota bacterium]